LINQQLLRQHLLRFGQTVQLCGAVVAGVWKEPRLGGRLRQVAGLQMAATLALFVLLTAIPFVGPDLADPGSKASDSLGELLLLLVAAHMVVLGLSFEFHDDLTRRASLWLGVVPEDPDRPPRFRFNLGWVRKRIRRRWRGWLIMTVGIAMLAPLRLFNQGLHVLATTFWSLHWFGVFALGKSAVAWREPIHRAPWLIRMRNACQTHPWMYALPPVWIAHALQSPLHNLWPVVVNTEDHPGEALGLAGLHALSNVPVFGFLLRPWVSLCSAMLLDEGPRAALERVRSVRMGLPPRAWEETAPAHVVEEIIDARPVPRVRSPGAAGPMPGTDPGAPFRDTPLEVPRVSGAIHDSPHDTPVEVPAFAQREADRGEAPGPVQTSPGRRPRGD